MVAAPRCQDNLWPASPFIRASDNLFELSPRDLVQEFGIPVELSQNLKPRNRDCLDDQSLSTLVAQCNDSGLNQHVRIDSNPWWLTLEPQGTRRNLDDSDRFRYSD
jgi:hypothetical protein